VGEGQVVPNGRVIAMPFEDGSAEIGGRGKIIFDETFTHGIKECLVFCHCKNQSEFFVLNKRTFKSWKKCSSRCYDQP